MHASSQPLGGDTNQGDMPWHLSHQRERKLGESHERLLQYGKPSDGPDLSRLKHCHASITHPMLDEKEAGRWQPIVAAAEWYTRRRDDMHCNSPMDAPLYQPFGPRVSQCLPSSSPQNLCKSGDTWGFSTENNQPGVCICDCSAVSCMAASGPLPRFLLRSSPHAHSPPSSMTARVNLSPHDTAIRGATLRGRAYIAPGAGARGLISAQTETQTGGFSHASAEHTNVYKAT